MACLHMLKNLKADNFLCMQLKLQRKFICPCFLTHIFSIKLYNYDPHKFARLMEKNYYLFLLSRTSRIGLRLISVLKIFILLISANYGLTSTNTPNNLDMLQTLKK